MTSRRLLTLIIFMIVYSLLCHGQSTSFNLDRFVESIFDVQQVGGSYEDFYENLLQLHQNPLDINLATHSELKSTFILSDEQISNLKDYILKNGKLITLYELQVVDGFDDATILNLLPFVTVDPNGFRKDDRPLLERIKTARNHFIINRLETIVERKRGFEPITETDQNRYLGSALKAYLRYRVSQSRDFSFGFTLEKDPGETLIRSKQNSIPVPDFSSFHAFKENAGNFKRLIIGDYQLQFGQGLLLSSGFNVGKGIETINTLKRSNLGIRPYTSVLESGFLRGAAVTYAVNNVSFTPFFSRVKLDANIQENDSTDFFSSIQSTGLHRTPKEIASRKIITQNTIGLNAQLILEHQTSIGFIFMNTMFDLPIQRDNTPYQRFEFTGRNNANASIYFNTIWRDFRLFGEVAISQSGGTGGIIGFTKRLVPRIHLAMLARNYASDFHSFRGAAFGESGRNINEKGIYWGLKYVLNNKFFITAYYDSYQFPWLKFRVNAPSEGNDYLLSFNYNPNRQTRLNLQFRGESKEVNTQNSETGRIVVMPGHRNQYVLSFIHNASSGFTMKSRIQYSNYSLNANTTHGMALIQDASIRLKKWTFSGRIAFFDTTGSENRQYSYERDVLYAFSIPGYSGRGVRNYILIHYGMNRKIDLWLRAARTNFYDRDKIGTGLESISGDQRTELKLQMRYRIN